MKYSCCNKELYFAQFNCTVCGRDLIDFWRSMRNKEDREAREQREEIPSSFHRGPSGNGGWYGLG